MDISNLDKDYSIIEFGRKMYAYLFSDLRLNFALRHDMIYPKCLLCEMLESDFKKYNSPVSFSDVSLLYSEFNNYIWYSKQKIYISNYLSTNDIQTTPNQLENKIEYMTRHTNSGLFTIWAQKVNNSELSQMSFTCGFSVEAIKADYYTWHELDHLAKRWENFVIAELSE